MLPGLNGKELKELVFGKPRAAYKSEIKKLVKSIVSGNLKYVRKFILLFADEDDNWLNYTTKSNGSSLLHLSCQYGRFEATKLLIHENLDTSATNNLGQTPLILASKSGNTELVEHLNFVNKEIAIDAMDKQGMTALMVASLEGFDDIVEILLENGAKVDLMNFITKNTAFHYAAKNGYIEVGKQLLKAGAYSKNTNVFLQTPYYISAYYGHKEFAIWLKSKEQNEP